MANDTQNGWRKWLIGILSTLLLTVLIGGTKYYVNATNRERKALDDKIDTTKTELVVRIDRNKDRIDEDHDTIIEVKTSLEYLIKLQEMTARASGVPQGEIEKARNGKDTLCIGDSLQ